MKDQWIPFDCSLPESVALQFAAYLKSVKQAAISWGHLKNERDGKSLAEVETKLDLLYNQEGGYLSEESRVKLKDLEFLRRKLPDEKKEVWRLKSQALWFEKGDENTKKIHLFANHRKNSNTMWKVEKADGTLDTSLEEIDKAGMDHFKSCYKADGRATIMEVTKITSYFPRFVEDEDNTSLLEEVTKEELQSVLHSFQKDKIPRQSNFIKCSMTYWKKSC